MARLNTKLESEGAEWSKVYLRDIPTCDMYRDGWYLIGAFLKL